MTADQFQREVMDIFDLVGRGDDEKIVLGERLMCKAKSASTIDDIMIYTSASIAVIANATGYSLETIFQMTLDKLEKEYGR
jgi:hypothetical protein